MANLPPYKEVDVRSISWGAQDLMRDIGAKDANDVLSKMDTLDKYSKYVETSRIVRDVMDTKYTHDMAYQRNTDLLAQMNESWNANRYIADMMQSEQKRIGNLDKQAKRDLYSLRHNYQHTSWMTHYYNFVFGILVFTLYVTFALLILAALWRSETMGGWWLVVLGGVLLTIYAVILLILFRNTAMRRDSNWNQYYWKPSKDIIDSTRSNTNLCE